jgi:uncharacterized membrane protein YccC
VPTALAMANPRYAGVATAFAINFLAFLSPHPVMTYDPQEFLTGSVSVLIGILLATGVYLVVLPVSAREAVQRIVRVMREDLARLCLHERIPRRSAFEGLAYDRINQLMPLLQSGGKRNDPLLGGSVVAVSVGLEILRLRLALLGTALPPAARQSVTEFLKGVARDLLVQSPGHSWAAMIEQARRNAPEIAESDSPEALQSASAMRVIAAAIEDYPEFFRRQA